MKINSDSRLAMSASDLVLFALAPEPLRAALHTVERTDPDEVVLDVPRDSRGQLLDLVVAAKERRLLMQERRHAWTGEVGLVVCQSWTAGNFDELGLLAELVGLPGESWEEQTGCHQRLEWAAQHDQLTVVAHGPIDRRVAYAARVEASEGRLRIEYLARLLLTDYELAQWPENPRAVAP